MTEYFISQNALNDDEMRQLQQLLARYVYYHAAGIANMAIDMAIHAFNVVFCVTWPPCQVWARVRLLRVVFAVAVAEQRAGGVGEGGGELAILDELADRTAKRVAQRRQFGKTDRTAAGLDPMIGQPLYAEEARRILLRQPQRAAATPQCRTDAGLLIVRPPHFPLHCLRAEQTRRQSRPRPPGF
jgi:hypothetical protein